MKRRRFYDSGHGLEGLRERGGEIRAQSGWVGGSKDFRGAMSTNSRVVVVFSKPSDGISFFQLDGGDLRWEESSRK